MKGTLRYIPDYSLLSLAVMGVLIHDRFRRYFRNAPLLEISKSRLFIALRSLGILFFVCTTEPNIVNALTARISATIYDRFTNNCGEQTCNCCDCFYKQLRRTNIQLLRLRFLFDDILTSKIWLTNATVISMCKESVAS